MGWHLFDGVTPDTDKGRATTPANCLAKARERAELTREHAELSRERAESMREQAAERWT